MASTSTCPLPCTCTVPESVQLFLDAGATNTSDDAIKALRSNLQRLGWSPIQCHHVGYKAPTRAAIQSLFNSSMLSSSSSLLTYRNNTESGGHEQAFEAKESLELERRHCHQKDDDPSYAKVRDWCLALSKIAHAVNRLLDMPSNVFLLEDDSKHNHAREATTTTTTLSLSDKAAQDEEPLDLLRVFYYHAVPVANDDTTTTPKQQLSLGSSPHTDWGSWTVVWQDDKGGLETFCRKCQRWIPVPAAAANTSESGAAPDTWNCIIHVGDMASLALGRAAATSTIPKEENDSTIAGTAANGQAQWPSPRHRVVSPTQGERTSLVYFAYPPPSCSIQDMESAVIQKWNKSEGIRRLPLEEYYLLQDQSQQQHQSSQTNTAEETYAKWQSLTIRQVVQEKWKQVQRTY